MGISRTVETVAIFSMLPLLCWAVAATGGNGCRRNERPLTHAEAAQRGGPICQLNRAEG